MSEMPVAKIAAALGLEDPATFKGLGHVRGTGRTTRMLLEALSAVSRGELVAVAAHSMEYARQLTSQLRDWARQLGLRANLVGPPAFSYRDNTPPSVRMAGRKDLVFRDHFRG